MSPAPSPRIERVAVLGAGTMGHGIAQVAAAAGCRVCLYDVDVDAVAAGVARVGANLDKGMSRGKISAADAAATRRRVTGSNDLGEAVAEADLVVEAVPENLALKRRLFGDVAARVAETTILATNTSSLSIRRLAEGLPHPERVIGTHFFNPVHLMKLLEVIAADATAPEVVQRVTSFGERLGKTTILVRDSPGFATSRLGLVIGLEAIRMVEQGVASVEDIDRAMTLGYGFPMGPLRLTDLVGLDVRLHIAEYLSTELPDAAHFRPPQLLRDMVARGELGKKTGQGFYPWPE
ncbi:MAG: 3-hydroxyacyl-CoA dehydrogenase family protein [Myxococcales bacterium FL481]|nr:MAG: 3-hydroxyacyl-CoA dehydrogenase family protein [Myxococcales bacterium FL481]